jgi:hypothetical protein
MKRSQPKAWRRANADRVTPELVAYLEERDGGCLVARLEYQSGAPIDQGACRGRLTVEHVRDQAAMGGKRAPSDARHTLLVCERHIAWTLTARAKRLEREYLSVKEGDSDAD